MQTLENRRRAALGDFHPIRAFSASINLARLRRHLEGLKKRDGLTARAQRAAAFARRLKRSARI